MLESIKEIVADWVLVTYDIKVSKEGLKKRHDFLQAGKYAGAVMHTESVYYMPMSPEAIEAITKLAEGSEGQVTVWFTKSASPKQAEQLTAVYDKQVFEWLDKVGDRIPKISDHIAKGHDKMATNMIEKTEQALDVLLGIIMRRGSQKLFDRYVGVKNSLKQTVGAVSTPEAPVVLAGAAVEQVVLPLV